jgi:beta-galactosidase
MGRPGYLSGGKWLHYSLEPAAVASGVPAEGIILSYRFDAPTAANYTVWDRVGFELVRSPFEWRIDGGVWTSVTPDQPTIDVEELQTWVPLGWLTLGARQIAAGPHTLEIHLPKTLDAKGQPAKIKYASDALCITTAAFHPNGYSHPGQSDGLDEDDKAAAAKVFAAAAPATAAQSSTPLAGTWQITSDDEVALDDRLGPIKAQPAFADYIWRAIPIPSNRNKSRPEMAYVHRYWLRTRVSLPGEIGGHSVLLRLPSVNMAATVFVNGKPCGFTRNQFAPWDCDITAAVRPGQVNEIAIGIKDAFYGFCDKKNEAHLQYLPFSFWHYAGATLDMPVLTDQATGLLRTPSLVVAGKAYVADVFAMPSVKSKSLGLEITLHNSTAAAITVNIGNAVVGLGGDKVQKTFANRVVVVPAGADAVLKLTEPWENPRLWWPDDPYQYNVVTTLSVDGKPIDQRTTKFGFREWDWQGAGFKLNGVPWHGREDTTTSGQGDAFLATYQAHGQTMHRMWGESESDESDLDFMDAHGVCVRRTGIFDGEGANGLYDLKNAALWENYRAQLGAWIKGQRNHPSIFIWSIENEVTFINGHVFGNDEVTTREHHKSADVVRSVDPTRPFMVDGGNALLDESFPVYGGHYLEPKNSRPFQDRIYFSNLINDVYDRSALAHNQVWPITQSKPILLGENFYAAGIAPRDYTALYGEAASGGKQEAGPAMSLAADIFAQGYRWTDVSFDLWWSTKNVPGATYNAWKPIAALVRQWDTTFGSGQKVTRTIGLFNDTRFDSPITFTWTLTVAGKPIAQASSVHRVLAGGNEKFDILLPMPVVTGRQPGSLRLTLAVDGKQVFTDAKTISVLAPAAVNHSAAKLAASGTSSQQVAVFDPNKSVTPFLTGSGVKFVPVATLDQLPERAKVLVIGKDAIGPAECGSSALSAYALPGRVVIVLEQKNPLKYQALPGDVAPDTTLAGTGSIAFIEDPSHPLFAGLQQSDFFAWGGDGTNYRLAYVKPTVGGRSLVQCGDRLQDSAMAQMVSGKGLVLVSQLLIAEKVASNPVAAQLLLNMISYGRSYAQEVHPVSAVVDGSPQLTKALDTIGVTYARKPDPLAALTNSGGIAVVHGSPANIKALADSPAAVSSFTNGGGWIVLNAVGPDALADFNKLVGVAHIMRPFRAEKVTWPAVRNPLAAGLPTSGIVLGTGKKIFNFAEGEYPDPDAFSFVIDYDDVAPFAKSSFFAWNNIVNNYTMNDGFWPLIINLPAQTDGKPVQVQITLARPEKITQFTWASDTNYEGTTKVSLLFGDTDRVSFDTVPDNSVQSFAVTPPRAAEQVTMTIDDWLHDPAHTQNGKELVGIDNIYLKAYRSPEFYQKVKPLLNIGAIMQYPQGKGGIILCNVKFKDTEVNPENAGKKRAILASILHNLNAEFTGAKTIVAGASNMTYTPLDISKQANQYVTDQGWFGDKRYTFADLPRGLQPFAGVQYNIANFTTSPVPNAIMLGGGGIPGNLPSRVDGIPVGLKADALFFLQAARIDQRRTANDLRDRKQFEMADYIIQYADGQTIKVPIYAEVSVDDYRQATPAVLPGAQVAWTKPYAGSDQSAVAYSMQWNNPRPDVVIDKIDLAFGPDRRGIPALLAVTAASAR